MGLFGKPRISEAEVASQFVITILSYVRDSWPAIVEDLRPLFALKGTDTAVLSDTCATYEFGLAAMTIQLQALRNVIGGSSAQRIRAHVFCCLQTEELGSYPIDAIAEYEQAWSGDLSSEEPPHLGLAVALAERLELDTGMKVAGAEFHDPILLLALAGAVIKGSAFPFWEEIKAKHRIVA
jgi:hypothetical protein